MSPLKDKGYEIMLLGEIGEGESKKEIYFISPPEMDINSLKMELEEFAKSILYDTEVKVTGHDGLRALGLPRK